MRSFARSRSNVASSRERFGNRGAEVGAEMATVKIDGVRLCSRQSIHDRTADHISRRQFGEVVVLRHEPDAIGIDEVGPSPRTASEMS